MIIPYLLIFGVVVACVVALSKLFKVEVWISRKQRHQMVAFGILSVHSDNEAPTVRLVGKSSKATIGNVKMGEKDGKAYVNICVTDVNNEDVMPVYRTCGFVDQEGRIFVQISKNKAPEQIGYTACPSKPNEPSVVGERSWRTLWLKCRLNAYLGFPDDTHGTKELVATCHYSSFHSSRGDAMPPEARSAAFGVLFERFGKNNYQEFLKTPHYGWKDTALLSSLVYSIVYLLFYLLWKVVLNKPFSLDWINALELSLLYFPLWSLVRSYKIWTIENGNSIQPFLTLFNKSLGQKVLDWVVIACCFIVLCFLGDFYGYKFMPVAFVVLFGVVINRMLKFSSQRWYIENPFSDTDNQDNEERSLQVPEGDMVRNFCWQLDSLEKKDVVGKVSIFFDAQYITDLRYVNPFFDQRRDKPLCAMILDMFHYIKKHKSISHRLRYLNSQISKICSLNELLEQDYIQFALDFVQEPNIRFCLNKDSKPISQYEDYVRFPDEVLYDQEADSNSKAFLAAMMFHFWGYNVAFLYSKLQQHGAIGIEVQPSWIIDDTIFGKPLNDVSFVYNDHRYLFCETTTDGFLVGGMLDGMRLDDFEDKVELPFFEDEIDDSNIQTKTCVYNWSLDPRFGKQLQGQYTIEFDVDNISDLRQHNPFLHYAEVGGDYGDNIRSIFDFLSADSGRMSYVHQVALYIRQAVRDAGLDEIYLVQFALDFCQEPNIHYCIDEQSQGINFSKEYMRFPDEVLFDKEGDCDCKSSLAAALFHELGYNVLVMLSQKLEHTAIGIEYKSEWRDVLKLDNWDNVVKLYNGTFYLYCETTGDGFVIGQIKENDSIDDFETIVEIPK